jgi:regulator of replication initiation timing
MVKAAVASTVEFEAIDRLEQKLTQLLGVLDKARGDLARAKDENARLQGELNAARSRISESEGTGAELSALKSEREHIRGRVEDMLKQLEAIGL